ncbi:unnamed protein product, partial [Urochloa humidicola]
GPSSRPVEACDTIPGSSVQTARVAAVRACAALPLSPVKLEQLSSEQISLFALAPLSSPSNPAATLPACLRTPPSSGSPPSPRRHGPRHRLNMGSREGSAMADLPGLLRSSSCCSCEDLADGLEAQGARPRLERRPDDKQRSDTMQGSGDGRRPLNAMTPPPVLLISSWPAHNGGTTAWCWRWLLQLQR